MLILGQTYNELKYELIFFLNHTSHLYLYSTFNNTNCNKALLYKSLLLISYFYAASEIPDCMDFIEVTVFYKNFQF